MGFDSTDVDRVEEKAERIAAEEKARKEMIAEAEAAQKRGRTSTEKIAISQPKSSGSKNGSQTAKKVPKVIISGVDIPFWDLLVLIFKVMIAAFRLSGNMIKGVIKYLLINFPYEPAYFLPPPR